MQHLEEFLLDNSQIGAAVITAICGIVGIFINIVINFYFRNQDYKNKNRIQQIENMEIYYLPLNEKIRSIIYCIRSISDNEDISIYDVLDGKMGANYASKTKMLKDMVRELNTYFDKNIYKYTDSYNLFDIHRKVKRRIFVLNYYIEKNIKGIDEQKIKEILEELYEMIYNITKYEIKLMANCFVVKYIELAKLWWNYKKR